MARLFLSLAASTLILAVDAEPFKYACMAHDTDSCISLADDNKASNNLADAARYYGVACEGGSPDGCFKLGDMFALNGDLKLPSVLPSEILARLGQTDAVASTQSTGHVVTNLEASSQCFGGQMESCLTLANLLRFGEGLQQNLDRAASLYTRTCQSGLIEGCSALAQMFRYGWGGSRDMALALRVYAKACGAKHKLGCVGLGRMLAGGRGTDRQMTYKVRKARILCDKAKQATCQN